eukprot:gene53940-17994_t
MKDQGTPPNARAYTAAISACAKGAEPDKALELLTEMKEQGLAPTNITYTA